MNRTQNMPGARRTSLGAETEELLNQRRNSDRALRLSDLEGVVAETVLAVAKRAGLGSGSGGGVLIDGVYGDITVSGGGTVMTVNNGSSPALGWVI